MDRELSAMGEDARAQFFRTKREEGYEKRCRIREEKDAMRRRMTCDARFQVCVDCGWNEMMTEKEIRSLVKQIGYCYAALSRWAKRDDGIGVGLNVVGVSGILKEMVETSLPGAKEWPVNFSERSLLETFTHANLVYLTSDAETVLDRLESDQVYVIGGIVDRNRLKGATMDKAKISQIPTRRLNLDESVVLHHGSPVLTVNHVTDILGHAANGFSWTEAYLAVLPIRKGVTLSAERRSPNPEASQRPADDAIA